MTATPSTRLPEPQDTVLLGFMDPARSTPIAIRRDAIRALVPSAGVEYRVVVVDNVATTEAVTVWTVLGTTGEGANDGEAIVVYITDVDAVERDGWLRDNCESWLS